VRAGHRPAPRAPARGSQRLRGQGRPVGPSLATRSALELGGAARHTAHRQPRRSTAASRTGGPTWFLGYVAQAVPSRAGPSPQPLSSPRLDPLLHASRRAACVAVVVRQLGDGRAPRRRRERAALGRHIGTDKAPEAPEATRSWSISWPWRQIWPLGRRHKGARRKEPEHRVRHRARQLSIGCPTSATHHDRVHRCLHDLVRHRSYDDSLYRGSRAVPDGPLAPPSRGWAPYRRCQSSVDTLAVCSDSWPFGRCTHVVAWTTVRAGSSTAHCSTRVTLSLIQSQPCCVAAVRRGGLSQQPVSRRLGRKFVCVCARLSRAA
jgi:hypothetical protein